MSSTEQHRSKASGTKQDHTERKNVLDRTAQSKASGTKQDHTGRKKKPPTCANMLVVRKIPGAVLLSHSQIYSTIAAGALNYRVREGNECFCSAMDTGKYKTKK